ncbi:MAG: glycosyl hydrolase [Bacteroidetes bacterium]|nr:glycosyl hydrolase [Bacteroidota bacterium]MCL6101931.1 glycosyl hydrolase [Bacteroidota bacterium]
MKIILLILSLFCSVAIQSKPLAADTLKAGFLNPPDSAKPGVYWYFMDGNISREAMTADLESMKAAGIGYVIFLEVNVGVPRGKVDFLSEEWQDLYAHAVRESERLGIRIILGSGPGWAGSGGPWVKPEQSMMHLVSSSTEIEGPSVFHAVLPKPEPRKPFFGEGSLTAELKKIRDSWYEDVAVLAFPTPNSGERIADLDEKALYYRAPYTAQPNVKQFLPAPASFPAIAGSAIDQSKIIDLTRFLQPDGSLQWTVPQGKWTILRFGKRNNGAVTRPAPKPGLGFECDKFDTVTFDTHFNAYIGKLLNKVGPRKSKTGGGWTMIHIDSWEMGSQNWTGNFREQFKKRRGYDPLLFLPTYSGQIVGSLELSERFLWDVRLTSQELILKNHAGRFKELGRRNGFTLSIEPYGMNPTADLDLGSVADVPMCEFWSDKFGFNSSYSCIEATSIAHVQGKPVVAAESFTANSNEAWKKYPGNMKDQSDWAFSMGINRFIYHTFAHKPYGDRLKPGVTMGPYGVHWDRTQTWWPMVPAYHKYVSRCQYVLSQGKAVADILYLTPEGAPHVFRAPSSALEGTDFLPDKRGYAFDGCSPLLLREARVSDHRIVFPGGASYRVMVLPDVETMTPELLSKIASLVKAGAVVMGNAPSKSPSLVNYPRCDEQVQALAKELWGERQIHQSRATLKTFKSPSGQLITELYSPYDSTAALLKQMGVNPDFTASGSIRYTHRSLLNREIYFISNRTNSPVENVCLFRDGTLNAELWDAVTGEIRPLNNLIKNGKGISIKIKLDASQSLFVVFYKSDVPKSKEFNALENFPDKQSLMTLKGAWTVAFDTTWGGPEKVVFDSLADWTTRKEEGIRHYSGIARYSKTFDLPESSLISKKSKLYLNLGNVKNMARVKLNGKDLGVVWTFPWQVDISGVVKGKGNKLEIEVANLWANRLIGDESLPDDGIKGGKWPDWILNGTPRPTKRYTFTTYRFYKKDDPLLESGLMGPVSIMSN